jgi:hypothetical protein
MLGEEREGLRRLRVVLQRKRNRRLLRGLPGHAGLQGAIRGELDAAAAAWRVRGSGVPEWTVLAKDHGTLLWHDPAFLRATLCEALVAVRPVRAHA